PLKHSPRFGQEASSHTLCSLFLRSSCLMRSTSGETGMRTRIQSGFFSTSSVGMILTGMRASFSAPRSLTPVSTLAGLPGCSTVFIAFDPAHQGHCSSVVEVAGQQFAELSTYLGKSHRLRRFVAQ